VDPLSHAALGRTLIAFDSRHRLGPGASAACILGSLSPDLDLALGLQGWDVYLRAHQAGTHALAGALACGALTATVVRLAERRSRWVPLLVAATAGAFGHLALDLLAGADIRPGWPVWNAVFTLPLFAMADPWLVGLFVAALALLWRARRPAVALAIMVALACMAVTKGALYARAKDVDRRAVAAADPSRADAVFGSWHRWAFFHVSDGSAERWEVDALSGSAVRAFRIDRGLSVPSVDASRALPTVTNLMASHAITFARVRGSTNERYAVLWSDLRYCSATLVGSEPLCGLWFGGEYEARGRAIDAVVHVGTLVQRRPVERTPANHE
jgi:membrane-bound metal-dependent hydrolase YbcI (DUF457 family)